MLIIAFGGQAWAQQIIKGKVIDAADRSAIIGASVRIKGTKFGVTTDIAGNFKISAKAGQTLVFSYIGYIAKEVEAGNTTAIVALSADSKTLNTVVVTALGISKSSQAIGYSAQVLSARQLGAVTDPNLVNDMQGKVAGVQIINGSAGVGSTSRVVIDSSNIL